MSEVIKVCVEVNKYGVSYIEARHIHISEIDWIGVVAYSPSSERFPFY